MLIRYVGNIFTISILLGSVSVEGKVESKNEQKDTSTSVKIEGSVSKDKEGNVGGEVTLRGKWDF